MFSKNVQIGFAPHPQNPGQFRLFLMKLYQENFLMEYHPTYTIYLNRSNPKILQF